MLENCAGIVHDAMERPHPTVISAAVSASKSSIVYLRMRSADMVKRSIWAMRDSDLPEGSPCKFAALAPKVKPSGDAAADQEHEVLRRDLIGLVDILVRNPEHIQPTKGWLEQRVDRVAAKAQDTDCFKDSSTLAKVLSVESFLVALIMRNTGLSQQECEKAKSYDGESLKYMALYMTELSPGLQLPDEMAPKQIANLVLDQRIAKVGERLKGLKLGHGFNADGSIAWMEVGPYGFTMNNGQVEQVLHRPSSVSRAPYTSLGRCIVVGCRYTPLRP